MWYSVYDLASNVLLSVGDSLGAGLPDATRGVQERATRPDLLTEAWSESTQSWGARPIVGTSTMSKGDWMARMGVARRIALNMAYLDTTPAALQLRATIKTLQDMLDERSAVDVTYATTIFGAGSLADILITIGQLTTGGRDAFIAMMLAPAFA